MPTGVHKNLLGAPRLEEYTSFIYSFHTYSLSTYSMPDPVLQARTMSGMKPGIPTLVEPIVSGEGGTRKKAFKSAGIGPRIQVVLGQEQPLW